MILRPSQKLSAKIKACTTETFPPDENPFADWSAHLFVADRVQYIIACNTRSLYSTVMYGKGVTDENQFIQAVLRCIRESLEHDAYAAVYDRFIATSSGTVRFAKALNRSVTGSMNDLIVHATAYLTEVGMSPFDVGFTLNGIPFAPLAAEGRGSDCTPNAVFKSLVKEAVDH